MIVKPGYRTTEFVASVLASAAAWIAQWAGTLEPRWAAIVTGVAASAYAISRGLTKFGALLGASSGVPVSTTQTTGPPPVTTPQPPQAV